MKESNTKVVVTCKYHKNPHSSNESVMAVGKLDGKELKIHAYTPHFRERGGRCIGCGYSKIYFMDGEGNVKERSGIGKIDIKKVRIEGEEVSYEKITEKASKLGFPYS